jgi:hypothetical protein
MTNSFHRKQSTNLSESSSKSTIRTTDFKITHEQLLKTYKLNLLQLYDALSLSFKDSRKRETDIVVEKPISNSTSNDDNLFRQDSKDNTSYWQDPLQFLEGYN